MAFSSIKRGVPNSSSYRIFIRDNEGPISALHDVPLYDDNSELIYNVIITSPRGSNAKMKLSVDETLNPIKQEVKHGQLCFIRDVHPHQGYPWNLGVFPQTRRLSSTTNQNGRPELDSVEILEIGQRVAEVGDVIKVKVLGSIALKDERTRVIGIDTSDPLTTNIRCLSHVMESFPELIGTTIDWLEYQSFPERGRQIIEFKQIDLVHEFLNELHKLWANLVRNPSNAENLSTAHVLWIEPFNRIQRSEAQLTVRGGVQG